MSRKSSLVWTGAILWSLVGLSLVLMLRQQNNASDDARPGEGKSNASGDGGPRTLVLPRAAMTLADFELTNIRGEKVTKKDVLGHPTVYGFIFSRCITTCRPITAKMKELHDAVGDTDARFVSVTIDPEYDTVEQFGRFSEIYDPDPQRWQFLTGDKAAIHSMIEDGFQLVVQEMFGAERKPGQEFTHTNRVALVNAEGIPVRTYLILNDGDFADLKKVLQGRKPMPEPPGAMDEPAVVGPDGSREPLSSEGP